MVTVWWTPPRREGRTRKIQGFLQALPLHLAPHMAQRDPAQDDTTRILIADGDRDSRLAMSWCLLSEGYRIDPVSDGFSAAAALEQTPLPTVAMIDLGLQGFGGRRLIEHIHVSPRLRSIHIIATGYIEPFAPLPAGVTFLKKPCDGEVLLKTIRVLGREDLRSFFPSRREHGSSHPGPAGGASAHGWLADPQPAEQLPSGEQEN